MDRKTEHLIVISFDALSMIDFDYIKDLPNFKHFLENASYCKNVRSIYPTLTYPAHTTIVTGREPKEHGIINNILLQPNREKPDWFWYRKSIKGETLYDVAIDNGLKVAALLWPVTAKSKIHYNMPEVLPNRPWQNQLLVSLFSGTPLFQYKLNKMFGTIRKGTSQPELDNFAQKSLLYTLKRYKPDLTLVHFTDLDSQRHDYGFNSKEAKEALHRHDKRLGEIIDTLKEENIYEKSTLVLLGDHSSLNTNKIIYINSIFKEKGYIHMEDGSIKNWDAIANSCDGSSYIYVKDKDNKKNVEEIRVILDELAKDENNGIEKVYSSEEASMMGADPNCSFMLEARLGYYFLNGVKDCLIKEIDPDTEHKGKDSMRATHGYSPDKHDYRTVFMLSGQGIKPHIILDNMSLLDEASTMANLLGLSLKQSKGRTLEEFLEK